MSYGPCMCGGCRRCLHDQGYQCGDPRCWCTRGVNAVIADALEHDHCEPDEPEEDEFIDEEEWKR